LFKRLLFPIVILLIAFAIFAQLKHSKAEKSPVTKTEKVWRVSSMPVIFQDLQPELVVYGRIETPNQAHLSAALVADVIEVRALEGQRVTKGQKLIKLDDRDIQLLIKQRQAELKEITSLVNSEKSRFARDKKLLKQQVELVELAEQAVARAQKLEKSKMTSRSVLDDTIALQKQQVLALQRLEYDIADHSSRMAQLDARRIRAQALLSQAELDLSRTAIKAPFEGRVASLSVAIGDRVRAGDKLISVYELNTLEVRAQLPGRYIPNIRSAMQQGKTVTATATINNQSFTFQLDRFSGEVQRDSGGIDGLFRVLNDGKQLTVGAFVELRMALTEEKSVISIPYDALYELGKIYQISDGRLQAIKISRVGEYRDDSGEVRLLIRSADLVEDDKILTTQLPNAIPGLRVEALNEQ